MVKKIIQSTLAIGMSISLLAGCGTSQNENTNQETQNTTNYAEIVNNLETDLLYAYQEKQDGYYDYYLGYYDGKVFINEQNNDTDMSIGYSKCLKTVDIQSEEEEIILDCSDHQYYIQYMAKESDFYYFDIFDAQNMQFKILKYDGENIDVIDEGTQTYQLNAIKFFPTADRIWYLRFEEGNEADICYILDGQMVTYKHIIYKNDGQGYWLLTSSDDQYFYTVIDKTHVFYSDGTNDYELDFDYNVYNFRLLDGYYIVNETYTDKTNAWAYRVHLIDMETMEDVNQYDYGVADTKEIADGVYVWSVQTNASSGARVMTCYVENNELIRDFIEFETNGNIYTIGQNHIIEQTEIASNNNLIHIYEIKA